MPSSNLQRPRGLVLTPFLGAMPASTLTREEEKEHIQRKYNEVEWIFLDSHPEDSTFPGRVDYIKLAEMGKQLILENNITVILGGAHDSSILVHSYFHELMPDRIKGPSMESLLMANSKLLTRQHLVPEGANLKYSTINLDQPDIHGVIQTVGLPMILKQLCGTASVMIQVCHSISDVEKAVEVYRSDKGSMVTYKQKFGHLIPDNLYTKFPHLSGRYVIAEEYVDSRDAISTQTCDMFIQDGQCHLWGIVDNIYCERHPQLFLGCGFPSLLPDWIQTKASAVGLEVARKMAEYGFNDNFLDVEFWAMNDGSIKVMEVNPRAFLQVTRMYDKVLDGDVLQATIDFQLNKMVKSPILKNKLDSSAPKYGLQGYINVITEGKANDIYNYEFSRAKGAECGEFWWLNQVPEAFEVKNIMESGFNFGYVFTTGKNFKEAKEELKEWRMNLLKGKYQLDCWEPELDWEATLSRKIKNLGL